MIQPLSPKGPEQSHPATPSEQARVLPSKGGLLSKIGSFLSAPFRALSGFFANRKLEKTINQLIRSDPLKPLDETKLKTFITKSLGMHLSPKDIKTLAISEDKIAACKFLKDLSSGLKKLDPKNSFEKQKDVCQNFLMIKTQIVSNISTESTQQLLKSVFNEAQMTRVLLNSQVIQEALSYMLMHDNLGASTMEISRCRSKPQCEGHLIYNFVPTSFADKVITLQVAHSWGQPTTITHPLPDFITESNLEAMCELIMRSRTKHTFSKEQVEAINKWNQELEMKLQKATNSLPSPASDAPIADLQAIEMASKNVDKLQALTCYQLSHDEQFKILQTLCQHPGLSDEIGHYLESPTDENFLAISRNISDLLTEDKVSDETSSLILNLAKHALLMNDFGKKMVIGDELAALLETKQSVQKDRAILHRPKSAIDGASFTLRHELLEKKDKLLPVAISFAGGPRVIVDFEIPQIILDAKDKEKETLTDELKEGFKGKEITNPALKAAIEAFQEKVSQAVKSLTENPFKEAPGNLHSNGINLSLKEKHTSDTIVQGLLETRIALKEAFKNPQFPIQITHQDKINGQDFPVTINISQKGERLLLTFQSEEFKEELDIHYPSKTELRQKAVDLLINKEIEAKLLLLKQQKILSSAEST